jgi:cell division protein YceG involved in septum cleavage
VKLIDGKSVLLGLGLGIIITSIIGVIFFAGYQPQLSDAEIVAKAQKLGMVDRYAEGGDIGRNSDGTLVFTIKENESFTQVSKRLYEAGIIESSIEFEIMIKKDNLEEAIKPGRYNISFNDDLKTIIKKITK